MLPWMDPLLLGGAGSPVLQEDRDCLVQAALVLVLVQRDYSLASNAAPAEPDVGRRRRQAHGPRAGRWHGTRLARVIISRIVSYVQRRRGPCPSYSAAGIAVPSFWSAWGGLSRSGVSSPVSWPVGW